MNKDIEHVMRQYNCRICGENHDVVLNANLLKEDAKYPIPYVFLHGDLKNILTTLYLDKDLQIRGVDVQELGDDDIFSKEQVISIINTLMKEIETLRRENKKMFEELERINKIRH